MVLSFGFWRAKIALKTGITPETRIYSFFLD
jgi:hypothetical protein